MTSDTNSEQPSAWSRQVGGCSVSGCERRSVKRDLCSPHYQRLRKHGDATRGGPIRSWNREQKYDPSCAVGDCGSVSRKRGWCMKHYDRWRKHGTPTPDHAPTGHRRMDSNGYILVACSSGGGPWFEHRLAWEAVNGPLLAGQNIHHKNGDRTDNRPANLEVWDTSQPAGQRPEDKVEFAIEMLRRYAPEHLRE